MRNNGFYKKAGERENDFAPFCPLLFFYTKPNCRDIISSLQKPLGEKMKEIEKKIQMILETPIEETQEPAYSPDLAEAELEGEFGELYTDLYVLIKNIDDFFGAEAKVKALELADSFLLESLILLKKNPDVIRVESGDDFVKATAYTPEGATAGFLFDCAVQINTMLEVYNKTLAENEMTRIEAGIGMATFPGNPELEDECECDEEHECTCGQEHSEDDTDEEGCQSGRRLSNLEFGYATDFENQALDLATIANSDELDPIVIDETLYSLMSDSEQLKEFLDHNLEKVIFEGENFSIFHGNIISEEE
jgi:hypothetical protein